MIHIKRFVFICSVLILISIARVAPAVSPEWNDTSLTLLGGSGFEVDADDQITLTFEHASSWSIGDLFLFVDFTNFPDSPQANGVYGEFSPRLNLTKMRGRTGTGVFKDILITTTIEFGKGDVEAFLIGPGFDFALPGFDFFQFNIYRRFPLGGVDGETIQITPVWSISTKLAGSDLIFDGFIDWNITDDGLYSKNLHFNPQIKYDLSNHVGIGSRTLLIGVEYSYWRNKYGIQDSPEFRSNESAGSLLLQVHF